MNFPFISNRDFRTEVAIYNLSSFGILVSNILPQGNNNFRTTTVPLHHPTTSQFNEIQIEASI